ncbi:unnamed protein product [Rotaria magnacalcarata]|uniref:t-SNARE coiled-coil homology domain-containing protein n=1 Tax=Rotaria magnacalcarata TaxID=392030 RepID=A0A819EKJ8_9BILA|nr:unnamed protein product [Rotaria magnacalcarata]
MADLKDAQIYEIVTEKLFDEYINSPLVINKLLLVHIELEQISVCKIVNEGLLAISRDPEFMQQLAICRLNADHFYDLLNAQHVSAAPTILFYHRTRIIDRIDGFNQSELLKKIKSNINKLGVVQTTQINTDSDSQIISAETRIKQLLESSPTILFMKGTPASPQCGFSRQACHLLDEHKIKYDYFDVLADQHVREQLKKYSNWNTYPQLYVGGELIGGLDIMKQMIENGDFELKLRENKVHEKDKDMRKHLESLINRAHLMLFIKGTPETPRCGFTKELLNLLAKANITDYKTFDILEDENVRTKLKEYSSWQTYPQIYVNGQFIGGLDILKQMNEEGTIQNHESCKNYAQEINENINEFNKLPNGSSQRAKKSSTIRTMISELNKDVDKLSKDLTTQSRNGAITQREANRRRTLVDAIKQSKEEIEKSMREGFNNYSSRDRMDPRLVPAVETESTQGLTNEEMTGVRTNLRKSNDEAIDALHAIVKRQKEIGIVMHTEVDRHNEIIDTITDRTGLLDSRVKRQTMLVNVIDQKSSTLWLWVVIILLFIAIVVIASVPFKK